MKTVKVDEKQRVRLADAKPGQVLSYESHGLSFTLTVVESAKPKPARMVRRNGASYLVNDARIPITNDAVRKITDEFP